MRVDDINGSAHFNLGYKLPRKVIEFYRNNYDRTPLGGYLLKEAKKLANFTDIRSRDAKSIEFNRHEKFNGFSYYLEGVPFNLLGPGRLDMSTGRLDCEFYIDFDPNELNALKKYAKALYTVCMNTYNEKMKSKKFKWIKF